MEIILTFILIVGIESFAIQQLSQALLTGSLFIPLRRAILSRMKRSVPGFWTLNEVFTCKLCMSMQMSLWFVFIPHIVAMYKTDLPSYVAGITGMSLTLTNGLLILGTFLYAIGISGLARTLLIRLDFTEKRFEGLAMELTKTQEALSLAMQTNKATAGGQVGLSLAGFHDFLIQVNEKCEGIECPFKRGDCYSHEAHEWLSLWAGADLHRKQLIPSLQHKLRYKIIPDYLEKFSRSNETPESDIAVFEYYRSLTA